MNINKVLWVIVGINQSQGELQKMLLSILMLCQLVYNRYDRYFKNRADYGLIGIWSVSANFLLLPISCTDFNNVGVSQKLAKIAQKMLVKHWN